MYSIPMKIIDAPKTTITINHHTAGTGIIARSPSATDSPPTELRVQFVCVHIS